MTMQEKSTPTKCPTSTCSVPDFLAKASRLRENGLDSKTQEELCSLKLPDSLQPNGLHFFFWKTSRDCYRMTGARRLKPSTPRLLKWGIILNGVCITADISESPSSDGACILSDILIPDVPDKIFPLSGGNAAHLRQLIGGAQGQRVYDPNGVACTQAATSGGWGGKTGLYFIDMNADPIVTDVARCITARQDSGVSKHRGEHSAVLIEDAPRAILTPDREKVRQQGRRIKEPDEPMFTITAQDRHGILHRGRIRKLMPIECWRLQGYADEQFNKAAALGLKDGHLYKMAGNSVSVPVISAIGQRIKTVNEKYEIVR